MNNFVRQLDPITRPQNQNRNKYKIHWQQFKNARMQQWCKGKTEVPYPDLKLSVGSTRLMSRRTAYVTRVKSTILEKKNVDA